MKLKQTLTALIIATTLVSHANAAQAYGWSWSWFSLNIIAPNNIVTSNN